MKYSGIDGIDGGKVVDIGQEHGGLGHVGKIHAGGLEHGAQIIQRLTGLGLHALGSAPVAGTRPSWPEVYSVLPASLA